MTKFPKSGMNPDELLQELHDRRAKDIDWKSGKAFSLVYYPGDEYSNTIKQAFNLFFSENALNPTAFPSLRIMEHEVVSMTADMLNGPSTAWR